MKPTLVKDIHPDVQAMIEHFQFDTLPVEGTLYKSVYRSPLKVADGEPASTAMIGMYSSVPFSVSCFHKLKSAEVWHVYGGDPFMLVLLHEDGSAEQVLMGNDPLKGQHVQYVVPENTWQAGYLIEGGLYALFGCTMAPGFCGKNFLAGTADELIRLYPDQESTIKKLSVNGHETQMPEGFEDD
ncbi:cupin domain-containing protein [Vibrio splendidus]|uniref:cupin domain-containing protein n=1 Tax=Vibrio splendidus TaxID=29497 RepID=UPI002469AA80|nr:cupin domain-containing protein [Vibrio splendidus]MDH6023611.1 cupin domain-containing protein [Vibrio splendidus]